MSSSLPAMQIDIHSVQIALFSWVAGCLSYAIYAGIIRKDRLSVQRMLNDIAALWLSYDALVHAVVVAFGMAASALPPHAPPSSKPPTTPITLVWQAFAQSSQTLRPEEMVAQLAVTLVVPVAGYAALMWWREQRRWREGEMVAAALEIYATVLGFISFRPERLRDMEPERRQMAFRAWGVFFFLNMLWLVIPAALLWFNFKALYLDGEVGDDEERETMHASEMPILEKAYE